MNIEKRYVSPAVMQRVTFGGVNGRKFITVHQTGNTSKGANAEMHARLQSNGNSRSASWHYQVDDTKAIQSFPHSAQCFAAGDGRGNGNLNSIHVEICINSDGDYKKAVENGAKVVRRIMKEEGISIMNVKQHYDWSRKNCPAQIRAGKDGIDWKTFINMVKDATPVVSVAGKDTTKPSPSMDIGANLIKNENAYFLVTTPEGIKVRNKPSVKATHTGTLKQGDSINYFKVYEGGGYRWLEYVGYSGRKLYVPYRESGTGKKQWGTFHSSRPQAKPTKSIDQMAREVIAGKHGNGHAQRQKSLGISSTEYHKVRARVNRLAR